MSNVDTACLTHCRKSVKALVMVAVDLCANYKPWDVHLENVKVIIEEFYAQVLRTIQCGDKVSPAPRVYLIRLNIFGKPLTRTITQCLVNYALIPPEDPGRMKRTRGAHVVRFMFSAPLLKCMLIYVLFSFELFKCHQSKVVKTVG